MFYVNDIDGLKFTGPLEELEQWGKITRRRKIAALTEEKVTPSFGDGANAGAIAAYQKYLSGDNDMVEPLIHAHQIMSSPVLTIRLETPLIDAWNMLEQQTVRQVVVTTEQRKVLGMLSERDLLKRINIIDNVAQASPDLSVSDVVNREIISTHSISDIRRIAKVLAQFHIDSMPVVEDEVLIGIVTRGDILRGFADNPKLNLYA